jgi:phage shock protein A
MALIKRLSRITAARIEAFLSTTEDPENALPYLAREMEKQVALAGRAVAKALAAQRGAQRGLDEVRGRITRLENGARMALEHGDEALAREALTALVKTERDEKGRVDAVAGAQKALADAREARTRIEHQLGNLKANTAGIIARSKALRARRTSRIDAAAGSRPGNLLEQVAAMETRVDREEAEIEINRASRERITLEERLKELERRSEIEERVRRLRRQREQSAADCDGG